MKTIIFFSVLLLLNNFVSAQELQTPQNIKLSEPVFQVDFSCPTADKPQSKLWFMDDCWWAVLPRSNGPSLWQRTNNGWIEHKEINKVLDGIPGRADVCVDGNTVTAVGVDTERLVVFCLEKKGHQKNSKWNAQELATLLPVNKGETIETATIALDQKGHYWVSAIAGDKLCVWESADGKKNWQGPQTLAERIGEDDICTISEVAEGVVVVWSDELKEAVRCRTHNNGKAFDKWEKEVVIEEGNKTADDHLNAALSKDNTLWLATKNSFDVVGKPQFVLRVRSPKGDWKNYPYCNLGEIKHPSRPIILTVENNPSLILSGYTIYNTANQHEGNIVFGVVDTTKSEILTQEKTVIMPDASGWTGRNHVNNLTGCKTALPKNAPWIVLASDDEGHVYEADLSKFFKE